MLEKKSVSCQRKACHKQSNKKMRPLVVFVVIVLIGSTVPHNCHSASSLKLLLHFEGSLVPSSQPQGSH